MKAHWTDVIKFVVEENPVKYPDKIKKCNESFKKAYAQTTLLKYDYTESARKNLNKLEVGQGYIRYEGVNFPARSLLRPKNFKTYLNKLIVRVV